jgi:hypothetical protein
MFCDQEGKKCLFFVCNAFAASFLLNKLKKDHYGFIFILLDVVAQQSGFIKHAYSGGSMRSKKAIQRNR